MAKYITQHRRGDTDQWLASDIIPKDGELIIEKATADGTYKLKIGDGVNKFASLPYVTSGYAKTITLLANAWVGNSSPYSQVVNIDCITNYSRVDLNPTVEQLAEFTNEGITLVTENTNKRITVWALNKKPSKDYQIQITVIEVLPI